MYELPNVPELAPKGIPTASPRLRPVHGQDGSEHDAGAFVRPAQDSTGGNGGGAKGVAVEARQGHAYDHYGLRVIALESGTHVLVLPHREGRPGLSYHVKASELVPLPMTYYHGEVPR
jgi:hypothetical protein